MNKTAKRTIRTVLRLIAGVILFLVLYVVAGLTIPYIGVNKDAPVSGTDGEYIYILTNGVHTDLVLPYRNDRKDWSLQLSYRNTAAQDTAINYVAFGWGDKGFYLETPTWADLKASTAFKAMFFLSTSAMHVTFYRNMTEGEHCRRIWLSKARYEDLVRYIETSFKQDSAGQFDYIEGHAYGAHDGFYEAHRTYNLFFTCNTWANSGLKSAGLRACLWTPLDKGIFYQYRR